VTRDEREYIIQTRGGPTAAAAAANRKKNLARAGDRYGAPADQDEGEEDQDNEEEESAIPWFSLLTHPAAWAVYTNHFGNNWAFYTLLTWLPTYLKNQVECPLISLFPLSLLKNPQPSAPH
jgi:hypothetical protein